MNGVFYNEFDPFAAAWLRELIHDRLIAEGTVDEKDIRQIQAADVAGYERVHLFAGIGGWDYALQLAGWPADRPVWTGSCPCQPYSQAGKGEGDNDPRNLWPEMFRLIRQSRPECVFGEQVEGAVRKGWLDGICRDLEGEGYAVGSCVLGAHSVGAPHIRQRLYWVAKRLSDPQCERDGNTGCGTVAKAAGRVQGEDGERKRVRTDSRKRRRVVFSFDTTDRRSIETLRAQGAFVPSDEVIAICKRAHEFCITHGLVNPTSRGEIPAQQPRQRGCAQQAGSGNRGLANTNGGESGDGGIQPGWEHGQQPEDDSVTRGLGVASDTRPQGRELPGSECASECTSGEAGGETSFAACWGDSILIDCRDGKKRRIPSQPALFPLVDEFSNRVGTLRGAGNAIVPALATEFIKAFLEAEADLNRI